MTLAACRAGSMPMFHGATFANLRKTVRPRVWINASDIYNRTPACGDSDLPGRCKDPLPAWIVKARDNRNAPPMLSAFAKAISRYHDGEIPYIKLLDGGLVDNYGLAGFTIALLSARASYEPLSPEQAVKIRRGLFVVVDAETVRFRPLKGPRGADLAKAAANTAIDASVGAGYIPFERTMGDWQAALVRWRCGLTRRSAPLRGASGLERSRSVIFRRPGRFRSTRSRARRSPRDRSDPIPLAAAAGGRGHHGRLGRIAGKFRVSHVCRKQVRERGHHA